MRKVFLSGAVEGLSDRGTSWREDATESLEAIGFEVLNPCLLPDSVDDEPEYIVAKNLSLQAQADLLLVEYMIPNRAYIGTDFELVIARSMGKPIIVFAHPDHADRVYLRYLASVILPNMEAALGYLQEYYLSERSEDE